MASGENSEPAEKQTGKTKKQILRLWIFGLLGTLGLQFFLVGRFITGTLRLLYGALLWVICITVALTPQSTPDLIPFKLRWCS